MGFKNKIRPWHGLSLEGIKEDSQWSRQVGDFGQQIAANFLKSRDYTILSENYYSREGEIDLITEKDGQIVFVEVKTRLNNNYGLPEEAISQSKKEKLEIRQKISMLQYLILQIRELIARL